MGVRRFLPIVLALAGCAPAVSARVEPVIFGEDDRIEVYEVTRPELAEAVRRAVPAMIRARSVNVDDATGAVTFNTRPLGVSRDLCDGEAHEDQPAAASCSATLIDHDLVLTAGHCVDGWDCADQRFVFGWYYDSAGALHARRVEDVFSCAEVLAWEYTGANDYAIVRLDRPAPGPPMDVRLTPVLDGEAVSLAGYPFGIPMKVVENGVVTGIVSRSRFYARLDAHPGNSGSGVFDSELRVLGDLTNGPVEALVIDGDCNRLAVIGEDTTRTELISSIIPAVEALCATGHASERLCPTRDDAGSGADAASSADAAIGTGDAALSRDAGGPPADARSVPDAGAIQVGGGCGCRASGARHAPAHLALGLLALLRRGRRSGSAAST